MDEFIDFLYEMEIFIFITCGIIAVVCLSKWFRAPFVSWPPERRGATPAVFFLLPVMAFVIIMATLMSMASFDVVDDFFYLAMYLVMGFTSISMGIGLMRWYFDISWIDDAAHLNNRAALAVVSCAYIALALMYAGANVGDGPGWWCVVWAGTLGLVTWFISAGVVNTYTGVFERITIERDLGCGIRFGAFLLASGIILARASSGDWTSAWVTVVEFADGWPVLPLMLLVIVIERFFKKSAHDVQHSQTAGYAGSVLCGLAYVALAAASLFFLPSLAQTYLVHDSLSLPQDAAVALDFSQERHP